jgi:outer membrane protein OmpA-like peptidoglycan-associated protein
MRGVIPFVCAVCAAGVIAAGQETKKGVAPLVEGLTVVTAIHEPGKGDFESIKKIDAVSAASVHIVYDNDRGGDPATSGRTVRREDLKTARKYRNFFTSNQDKTFPGWTALGPSRAVVQDLLTSGEAAFTFQITGGTDRDALSGTLKKTGTDKYPVLLNGNRVELDAVKAEGIFGTYKVEFWILDDSEQPLTLRYYAYRDFPPELLARLEEAAKKAGKTVPKLSEHRLDVVKIEVPPQATNTNAQNSDNLEQKLEQEGRAEVYGIYFDFGKDRIKPESEPVLKEIAGLLTKNAAWKLSIEGHTDNIGGDAYNLDLSNRRAAAVKTALVSQYSVASDRLTTIGYGASRPKESNDTLAGRARNRRVELVRK